MYTAPIQMAKILYKYDDGNKQKINENQTRPKLININKIEINHQASNHIYFRIQHCIY